MVLHVNEQLSRSALGMKEMMLCSVSFGSFRRENGMLGELQSLSQPSSNVDDQQDCSIL